MNDPNPVKRLDTEPVAEPAEVVLTTAGPLSPLEVDEYLKAASHIATRLADIIKKKDLSVRIGNKDYVVFEGWTTLATLMGATPIEEWSMRQDDGGYVSRVNLVGKDGRVQSSSEALCGVDEKTWASRPEYARKSMACTRAGGKACRIAYSWVMVLAGYATTPAEEMPRENAHDTATSKELPILAYDLCRLFLKYVPHEGGLKDFKHPAIQNRLKLLTKDTQDFISELAEGKANEFQEADGEGKAN